LARLHALDRGPDKKQPIIETAERNKATSQFQGKNWHNKQKNRVKILGPFVSTLVAPRGFEPALILKL
jgi:hypothetical protein